MGASDQRERIIADNQFGAGANSAAPATWYCGLSTSVPNDDGSNFTEPVGGAYARVAYTNNGTNFPAAVTISGITYKRNGTKITWTNPTGNWGTIQAWGWFLTLSGGLPEYTFLLDSPIAVKNGNSPVEFDIAQAEMVWD